MTITIGTRQQFVRAINGRASSRAWERVTDLGNGRHTGPRPPRRRLHAVVDADGECACTCPAGSAGSPAGTRRVWLANRGAPVRPPRRHPPAARRPPPTPSPTCWPGPTPRRSASTTPRAAPRTRHRLRPAPGDDEELSLVAMFAALGCPTARPPRRAGGDQRARGVRVGCPRERRLAPPPPRSRPVAP